MIFGPSRGEAAARSVLADRSQTRDKPAAERTGGIDCKELQPSARGRLRAAGRCATDFAAKCFGKDWRLRAAARAVRKNRIPDEPNETNLQKINLS